MTTEHLVVTGRSGAGVSTSAVNLSAALAEQGYRVAHLGYDRHRNSTGLLRGQAPLRACYGSACGDGCDESRFHCAIGFQDILCIECGYDGDVGDAGPAPEFAALRRTELIARSRPDFVVHDIAGAPETVLPFLRNEGEPTRIFVVTSASLASLATLNHFIGAVTSGGPEGCRFGGVISNNISGSFFEALVDDFTRQVATKPMVMVPHSLMVSFGEYGSRTVIESAPQSHLSSVYRKLARLVVQGFPLEAPQYLSAGKFAAWQRTWCEITEELECGLVRDGAAI
jgi:nitrogenase iron protein NifH